MKIFFLTRSLYPYQKSGGGQIRLGQIKYLQELGWDVTVVMPNYTLKEIIIEDNIIQIPFKGKFIQKLASLFERIGFYEDYLDKWVENAFEYLKDKIKKEDIVFATSGGELGTIKLGSILHKEIGCKFVINFRDPLDYSLVNDLKVNNKFHISREKQEKKYISNADLIITSTNNYKNSLIYKYPHLRNKIFNNYFGYVEAIELNQVQKKFDKIAIAYSGSMLTDVQKPEVLYYAFEKLKNKNNIEIYFIGDISQNKTLLNVRNEKLKNIKFIDYMTHEKYLEFMQKNIDIGFVSLSKDYYQACVPSKIYEYINLGLPMIGALPDGDGKEIINQNGYGIACKYDDIEGLVEAIEKFKDSNFLSQIKQNILNDRNKWAMKEQIKEVDYWLKEINED